MKNTTKLKNILQVYAVTFNINDQEELILSITHKANQNTYTFTNKSYTAVISKAFSHLMKEVKRGNTLTD